MVAAQERHLNTVQVEIRNKFRVGSFVDLHETIFHADISRVLNDRLIFKSRQRTAYFFEIDSTILIASRLKFGKTKWRTITPRTICPQTNCAAPMSSNLNTIDGNLIFFVDTPPA